MEAAAVSYGCFTIAAVCTQVDDMICWGFLGARVCGYECGPGVRGVAVRIHQRV